MAVGQLLSGRVYSLTRYQGYRFFLQKGRPVFLFTTTKDHAFDFTF
ncbi:hypothetical protein HMPREF9374_2177 [Desmospora sp. 8437]|nr:hypothetical protein HMPREF9374_2177 [Desmospora sp. 8437]